MSWNEIVLHLSYLLFFLAYTLKDVFWLRIMIILAASVDIVYRYWLVPEPSYGDIFWCVGDIVVNVYQIVMLWRERKGLFFTEEEKRLHKMVFANIPDLQYKRLLKGAQWQTYPEGEELVLQGTEVESLMVIFEGLAKVEVDKKVVSYLRNGNFVGEMSFLSGNLTTASVITLMPTRLLSWNKNVLREVMNKDEELRMAMHSVFSGDLLLKLTKHTSGTTTAAVNPA